MINWRHFDAWCCSKNINPIELPAYRFYNLAFHALREGLEEDKLTELEEILSLCDATQHPIYDLRHMIPKILTSRRVIQPEEPIPSVQKKKHDYIPPWWKGEEAAFKYAQAAMQGVNNLPKMN